MTCKRCTPYVGPGGVRQCVRCGTAMPEPDYLEGLDKSTLPAQWKRIPVEQENSGQTQVGQWPED